MDKEEKSLLKSLLDKMRLETKNDTLTIILISQGVYFTLFGVILSAFLIIGQCQYSDFKTDSRTQYSDFKADLKDHKDEISKAIQNSKTHTKAPQTQVPKKIYNRGIANKSNQPKTTKKQN